MRVELKIPLIKRYPCTNRYAYYFLRVLSDNAAKYNKKYTTYIYQLSAVHLSLLTLKHDIMKRILIVALLLITYNVNAQSGIQIINNTDCEVWFTLRGNTTATCSPNPYGSAPISIACCSTSVLYANPSTVPGGMQNSSAIFLTSSDYINAIRIHNSDPAGGCYDSRSVTLSDCNLSETHYTSDIDCQDECGLSITWAPACCGATYSIVTIN